MEWQKDFPVLIIDDQLRADNAEGRALRAIISELSELDIPVIEALSLDDGRLVLQAQANLGCVLVDWDTASPVDSDSSSRIIPFIEEIRERNRTLPIFLFTERLKVENIPLEVLSNIAGYCWLTEDTSDFIAGRIDGALEEYADTLLPPFFRGLVEYTNEHKDTWHTPGHGGGVAFLKSPVGRVFYRFFGENAFRSDLSVSVPELGSLMEHSEVVGEAEANAAKAFGADRTYFVTNGTSTANKMVFQGRVTPGEVVLVDRNCHKSALHSLVLTRAVPVYLVPTRNEEGIIGPIHPKEFEPETLRAKFEAHPLLNGQVPEKVRHAIVTNSTYDGLCYHTGWVMDHLKDAVQGVHFDEAWYAYACFHPMYEKRYAMFDHQLGSEYPAVFSTQSTHKLLAAFSQASMIHVRDGHAGDPKCRAPHDLFNEAFMMYTSTSPQYGIIASLDVATRMMQDGRGRQLVAETIQEAVHFRQKLIRLGSEVKRVSVKPEDDWWFGCWQPDSPKGTPFEVADDQTLCTDPECWTLDADAKWHGFEGLEGDYCMLDPIKVTVVTPGIERGGIMTEGGIPAGLVSRFLRNEGIVVEKTQFYSFLLLFSMGTTKGKSGTLLAKLLEFKRHHDGNVPVKEVFQHLTEEHQGVYQGMGLRDLARQMHEFLKEHDMARVLMETFEHLPPPAMIPAEAHDHMVRGEVELVDLSDLKERVAAVMVVPYPPGIPIIMPGERFSSETSMIIDYLKILQAFDNEFPGFETEVHGVVPRRESSWTGYSVYCLK